MGKFSIDGRNFSGGSVVVTGDGKVIIDGVTQDGELTGVVEVRIIEGAIENLHSEMSVYAGEVWGDVRAGMSVTCGNVGGNVSAQMSVTCENVHGDIDAGMSVSYRDTGWRDMSSAPKDGTRVLLWAKQWEAPNTGQFYGVHWGIDGQIGPFAYPPTHWQPLPAAPSPALREEDNG